MKPEILGYVYNIKDSIRYGVFIFLPFFLLVFFIPFLPSGIMTVGSVILSFAISIIKIKQISIKCILYEDTIKGNYLTLEGEKVNLKLYLPAKAMPFFMRNEDQTRNSKAKRKTNSIGLLVIEEQENLKIVFTEGIQSIESVPVGWQQIDGKLDAPFVFQSFGRRFGGLNVETLNNKLSQAKNVP